jgi:hypothetical protein
MGGRKANRKKLGEFIGVTRYDPKAVEVGIKF